MYSGFESPYDRRIFDDILPKSFVPFACRDQPRYEGALLACIETHVRPTDHVVIVGGGAGVTAAACVRKARSGRVTCYEAGRENVDKIFKTFARNAVTGSFTLHNAVVGEAISVWGTREDRIVHAEDLPECDVLELDCEGAEIQILENMKIRPRVCLVETHGIFNSPSARVQRVLSSLGYEVKNMGVAEPDVAEYCNKRDIRVLCAVAP